MIDKTGRCAAWSALLPSGTVWLPEGRWDARFGHLRTQDSADLGYRLLVAEPKR